MAASRFASILAIRGKPAVLRRRSGTEREYGGAGGGFTWTDLHKTIGFQPTHRRGITEILRDAGIVEMGDAKMYVLASDEIKSDDRVVVDGGEYSVIPGFSPWEALGGTFYLAADLKRVFDSVSGSFSGVTSIFSEDFAGGVGAWTVKTGVWTNPAGEYKCVSGVGVDGISVAGTDTWTDYIAQTDGRVDAGDVGKAGLVFRYSGVGADIAAYSLMIDPANDQVTLEVLSGATWTTLLTATDLNLETDTDYEIRVHCFGQYLLCFVGGKYIFSYSEAAILEGQIGLRSEDGTAFFDDVDVWEE